MKPLLAENSVPKKHILLGPMEDMEAMMVPLPFCWTLPALLAIPGYCTWLSSKTLRLKNRGYASQLVRTEICSWPCSENN